MNRRGFLASLLAGVVAPMVLPGAGRRWAKQAGSEVVTPVTKAIINPAWINAPYEVYFYACEGAYHGIIAEQLKEDIRPDHTPDGSPIIYDPWPLRFEDAEGTKPIPPFMLV